MQRWKFGLILPISAIILAWGINGGLAQVQVTIADVAAVPQSTTSVAMLVSDFSAYEIISYQFEILYDSLVIQSNGVAVEGTVSAQWNSPAVNSDSAGRLIVGNFGTRALSPGDTLLKLIFTIVGTPGDTSAILLKEFQFNNGNPVALSKNGRLKILSPSGVAKPLPIVPRQAIYLSNSPEPFYDHTTIQMSQLPPGAIDIEIYNVLGRRIKRLGNFDSHRSRLEIDWDATDQQGELVPAGIYFCILRQFNRILAVDRMIFIK